MSGTRVEAPAAAEAEAPRSFREHALDWARTLAYAVALAVFLRTFFIGVFWIPSSSMEPTLHGADRHRFSDRVLVFRCSYGLRLPFIDRYVARWSSPKRGDVIVFTSGDIPQLQPPRDLIKRLVGLPGDTIEIVPEGAGDFPGAVRSGRLYINGAPATEPAFAERRYSARGEFGRQAITLGPGEYFALGDNTEHSNDSRFWGPVPEDYVLGHALCIYWPPNRIGRL